MTQRNERLQTAQKDFELALRSYFGRKIFIRCVQTNPTFLALVIDCEDPYQAQTFIKDSLQFAAFKAKHDDFIEVRMASSFFENLMKRHKVVFTLIEKDDG